ncbi:toxin Tbo-IT2-like isoform X2 [Chrysoperla carnea]|uniref:toxin Tbo-IT2-like isoform X2 n=1 Tax=Chrysoperla carnea TaxID=189513 RepID=UPI001D07172E|nr:toxin Tbo-IT2-like isoform X2 [Chrysoperla carnea]
MRCTWFFLAFLTAIIFSIFIPGPVKAGPYLEDEDGLEQDDYTENAIENLLQNAAQKRACIRRGGNCDHRPNDCCYNSACRCNLWGSNCRCQRMGLFQKWG